MADLINPAADLDRVACCALHRSGGCCDPEDCGPCCEACPTCPSGMRARLRDSVQLVLETPLSVSDDRAELVINTVFAHPEVLRALAGLPAAPPSDSRFSEMADGIREVIAHWRQFDDLDVEWLEETARRLREFAAAGVPAPDVAALLARCDAEDWPAGEFGWIQTTATRALLGTDTTTEETPDHA